LSKPKFARKSMATPNNLIEQKIAAKTEQLDELIELFKEKIDMIDSIYGLLQKIDNDNQTIKERIGKIEEKLRS